jgi:hypothetical protein
MSTNPYRVAQMIADARLVKLQKYVSYFDGVVRGAGADPTKPETIRLIVQQVKAATPEQWKQIGTAIGAHPPSDETLRLIVYHYEHQLRQQDEDRELMAALVEQRRDPERVRGAFEDTDLKGAR